MARLGILLAPDEAFDPVSLLETARAAAAADLGVWIPEHAHERGYAPSALALAGLVLGAVPTARVGTAGVIAGVRTSTSLQRDADVLASRGSFALGIVAGRDPRDFAGPEDFARRFDALESLVVAAAPLPSRRWQLLVGARSRTGMLRAARADGWLAPTFLPVEEVVALATRLRVDGPRTVVVVRRWGRGQRHGSRTPQDLVLEGTRRVRNAVDQLDAGGVDEIVLGPVGNPATLRKLCAELGRRADTREDST